MVSSSQLTKRAYNQLYRIGGKPEGVAISSGIELHESVLRGPGLRFDVRDRQLTWDVFH